MILYIRWSLVYNVTYNGTYVGTYLLQAVPEFNHHIRVQSIFKHVMIAIFGDFGQFSAKKGSFSHKPMLRSHFCKKNHAVV
jgi:hypothetical protein